MEIFELTIDDIRRNGIFKISLVGEPAMEVDYFAFNQKLTFAKIDEDQMMIIGPAMIPDKQILRRTDEGVDYLVYFTKETIKESAYEYMRAGMQNSVNVEHEIDLGGVTTVESWIIENAETDKSKHYGFSLPEGTWMIAMKVYSKDVWEQLIKSGLLKGFSIEGSFFPIREESIQLSDLLKDIESILAKPE